MELIANVSNKIGYKGSIEEIVLTPGMSVSVYYVPNLSNFIYDSKAKLCVGVSLCRVLSKDELSAVIAHELAHFSQPQTKYKAYLARVSNITSRLGRNGALGPNSDFNPDIGLYVWPARLFCRFFNYLFETIFDIASSEYLEVTADMELAADKISSQAFGANNMLSALCKSYGTSNRLVLYKALVLPYLSSYGYRCDGFWNTFEALAPLFKSIDNLDISYDKRLLDLKQVNFDLSECIFALRLGALEELSAGARRQSVNEASITVIPSGIQRKMDNFLCRKYNQTSGVRIGQIRLSEIIEGFRSGLFLDVHSMSEAFILLYGLFVNNQKERVGIVQEIMHEYERPPCDVVPQPVFWQISEKVYSSAIDRCPVCGREISEDTKICPHCHEIISE